MILLSSELPPIDSRYTRLSVECDFLLNTGYMASGFLAYDNDGNYTVYIENEKNGGYKKANAVKWRAKK